MPILAAWIGSLFTALATWFGTWFARKFAIRIAIISVFLSLTLGLIAAVYGLFAAITYSMPQTLVIAASWIVPSNAEACLSAIISAKVIAWGYSWNIKILEYKLA